MGVPAFFRWLSRKYPSIVVEVREENAVYVNGVKVYADASKPNPNGFEFDNLYLDMNGIIHPCTHPEDRPPPQTEAEMMLAIFDYLDRLFAIVRPRKVIYMAVDGVAPRAKMNQQRSRRFRAAKEAQDKEIELGKLREEKLAEGAILPPPPDPSMKFDSNCITPGTEFMTRLTEWLVFYVHQRMAENPTWRDVMVFLSDASVPGEGEHKIMDFIRRQRASADYDANTAHCLCGADADLIMLGLATHEPNFTIIREEFVPNKPRPCELCSQFGHDTKQCTGTARPADTEEMIDDGQQAQNAAACGTRFIYIRLNVLREYLERELEMPKTLRFEYSFERALDDFVFLCFFVGNDFLPHLPSLEIREGAIDRLVRLYKEILPNCDGFLSHNGEVQIERVEPLLRALGEQEDAIFQRRREDELNQRRRDRQRKEREDNSYWNRVARNDPNVALPAFLRDADSGRSRGAGQPGFERFSHDYLGRNRDRDRNQDRDRERSPVKPSPNTNNYDAANELRQQFGASGSRKRKDTDNDSPTTLKRPHTDQASEEPSDDGKRKDSELDSSKGPHNEQASNDAQEKQNSSSANAEQQEADPDELDGIRLWEGGWKERYYMSKFGVDISADPMFPKRVAREYARGLCWVLLYYYQGVPSWKWYYPFHYAPFASDFAGMRPARCSLSKADNNELNTAESKPDNDAQSVVTSFESGTHPFRPLEQLMGVFPPASRRFLPPSWQRLMIEENSPVLDLYPIDFNVDMNGKRFAWMGVALLPFVDEDRLFSALKPLQNDLTPQERFRNREGDDIILVSKQHPGFALLQSLYEQSHSAEAAEVPLDPKFFAGLAGVVRPWADAYPIEQPIHFDREGYNAIVKRNWALAALYRTPVYAPGFVFPAVMLEKAQTLQRTLKPADFETLNRDFFGFGGAPRRNRGFHGPHNNYSRYDGPPNRDRSAWQPVIGFGNADHPNNDPSVAQRMIAHAHRGHRNSRDSYEDQYARHGRHGSHYQHQQPSNFGQYHQPPQPYFGSDYPPQFGYGYNDYGYDSRASGDRRSRYDAGGRGSYHRNESAPPRDRAHHSYDAPRHAPPYAPHDPHFNRPHGPPHGGQPPFDHGPRFGAAQGPLAWNRMTAQQPGGPPSTRPPSFVPGYRRN